MCLRERLTTLDVFEERMTRLFRVTSAIFNPRNEWLAITVALSLEWVPVDKRELA